MRRAAFTSGWRDDSNPHLVLLPGLDGTGDLFAPFLAELDPGVRTHVVSYPTDRVLSIEPLADHAVAAAPPGPLVLIAESFSGLVVLEILGRGSLPVEAVVLVASFAEPPRRILSWLRPLFPLAAHGLRWAPGWALRRYCLGRGASQEAVQSVRRALRPVRPEVLAARLRQISELSPWRGERFDVPCLYLRAGGDRLVGREAGERLATNFNSFRLEEVDGPHFLLQSAPGRSWRRVREFLNPG